MSNNEITIDDGVHAPVRVYADICDEGVTIVLRQDGDRIHLDSDAADRLIAALTAQGLRKAA